MLGWSRVCSISQFPGAATENASSLLQFSLQLPENATVSIQGHLRRTEAHGLSLNQNWDLWQLKTEVVIAKPIQAGRW